MLLRKCKRKILVRYLFPNGGSRRLQMFIRRPPPPPLPPTRRRFSPSDNKWRTVIQCGSHSSSDENKCTTAEETTAAATGAPFIIGPVAWTNQNFCRLNAVRSSRQDHLFLCKSHIFVGIIGCIAALKQTCHYYSHYCRGNSLGTGIAGWWFIIYAVYKNLNFEISTLAALLKTMKGACQVFVLSFIWRHSLALPGPMWKTHRP